MDQFNKKTLVYLSIVLFAFLILNMYVHWKKVEMIEIPTKEVDSIIQPNIPSKSKITISFIPKEQVVDQFEKVTVVATGYTAGKESTGKDPSHPAYGITYSGIPVQRDIVSTIAADLDIFPLGTILYIPDYGYGIVADTGSAIKGNKIDLYFETVQDVYEQWGKRIVDVYVIARGNGKVNIQQFEQYNLATEGWDIM